ncbi:MAG: hypothetical protein KKI09_10480 [Spirochaetes bacterium]|nr:hypothetical protein [Spirochaetota bacterium]MBU0955843.1 hypothetical protein [Spirochaetota bacterium]
MDHCNRKTGAVLASTALLKRLMLATGAVLLLFGLLYSCATRQQSLTLEDLKQLPERQLAQYIEPFALAGAFPPAVADRFVEAPAQALDYMRRMDDTDRYFSRSPTTGEVSLFMQYYRQLPGQFRSVFEERVAAIYLIEGFMGGGMTDFVFDDNGEMFLILYLNPTIFESTLQQWLEYRDNSSFAAVENTAANAAVGVATPTALSLKVSCAASDGRQYQGLLHTLVHESVHVYDYITLQTPFIEQLFSDGSRSAASTAFTATVWAKLREPLPEWDFAGRKEISAYGLGPALPMEQAAAMYTALQTRPFASLYGTLSWSEDYAEAFTWFWLKQRYGIDYQVQVLEGSELLAEYSPTQNPLLQKRWEAFIIYTD